MADYFLKILHSLRNCNVESSPALRLGGASEQLSGLCLRRHDPHLMHSWLKIALSAADSKIQIWKAFQASSVNNTFAPPCRFHNVWSYLLPLPGHDLLHLALLLLDPAPPLLQLEPHAVQLRRDGVCNKREEKMTLSNRGSFLI